MKYLTNFKKIVLNSVKKGWLQRDPFLGFDLSKKEVERPYLTKIELERITSKEFATDRLNVVRDIFVFSCFTGLAYIGVQKLKRSQIVIGVDGAKWIFTHRQKSKEATRIPLLPASLQIIERYKDDLKCINEGKLLPVLSNQKMNAYLKEIAALQLDFRENDQNNNYKTRQYHQNYGFDLEGTLSKYPIKEMSNPQEKDHLLRSLKRGNVQKVTFEVEGQSEVRMIEAAPKFKSINIYNSDGRIIIAKTLNQSTSQPEKLADTTKTSEKIIQQSKVEGAKPKNDEEPSRKKASVRKQRRTL